MTILPPPFLLLDLLVQAASRGPAAVAPAINPAFRRNSRRVSPPNRAIPPPLTSVPASVLGPRSISAPFRTTGPSLTPREGQRAGRETPRELLPFLDRRHGAVRF